MKIKQFLFGILSAVIFTSAVFWGAHMASADPTTSPGSGSGAISASGNNLGVGGSAATGVKLNVIASTSDSSTYGLKVLQQNGTPIIAARGDGNVGIGTTSPTYPLSVTGNIQAAGGSFIGTLAASNLSSGVFASGNFAFQSSLGIGYSSQVGLPATLSVNGSSTISSYLNVATGTLYVNPSNGFVGIGTTTPLDKLVVSGASRVINNSGGGVFGTYDSTGVARGLLWMDNATPDVVHIRNNQRASGGTISFETTSTGASTMVILAGGNVGIGTTTPASPLTVAGVIYSSTGGFKFPDGTTQTTANAGGTPGAGSGWTISGTNVILATSTNNVGIGTSTPVTPLTIYGSALASFTGTSRGISSLVTPYDNSSYTALDFLYSGSGLPVARIAARVLGTGSSLMFGTSNSYASGVTNTAMTIDPSGNTSLGSNTFQVSTANNTGDPGRPWIRGDGNYLVINPKTGSDLYLAWDSGATSGVRVLNTLTAAAVVGNTSVTGGEVYTSNWFRNNAAGTGLFNQVNGYHLYSDGSYWTATGNGFVIKNGYAGTTNGFVYSDHTNFGLLNGNGAWAVEVVNGAGTGQSISMPGSLLVTGTSTLTGTVTVGATGTGKINVGTVDPIYTIGGKQYATYLPGMTGQKEETAGILTLKKGKAEIDFTDLIKGSDLWLFSKATNLVNNFSALTVLLTPGFDGRVWYEKDASAKKLIIRGDYSGEISYRLTAPRFDADKLGNISNSADKGFNLDELLK
jgi:hypothetical protein